MIEFVVIGTDRQFEAAWGRGLHGATVALRMELFHRTGRIGIKSTTRGAMNEYLRGSYGWTTERAVDGVEVTFGV